DFLDLGTVSRVQREIAVDRVVTRLPCGIEWVVTEELVLDQQPQDIDAETIDAPLEPEAQDGMHCLADVGVAPVEIRLRAQERMEIVLTGVGIELPAAAAEMAQPVVRRTAVGGRIAPQIPVALPGGP